MSGLISGLTLVGLRATPQLIELALFGASLRRKRYESIMKALWKVSCCYMWVIVRTSVRGVSNLLQRFLDRLLQRGSLSLCPGGFKGGCCGRV
jgi:hypothetical protein